MFGWLAVPVWYLLRPVSADQKKTHPSSTLEPVGLGISDSHPTIYKHLDTLALKFLGETMDHGMNAWDKPTVEIHQ